MRVERVQYFVEAVNSGSLRSAAKRLGMTQSVLSEQISALEEDLNIVLLRRTRNGVIASPAGTRLLPSALQMIDAQRGLLDNAASIAGALTGAVHVGATPILATTAIAPAAHEFRTRHPNVALTVREAASGDLLEDVLRGELDFCVATGPSQTSNPKLHFQTVCSLPLAVYVPEGHQLESAGLLRWSDLSDREVVSMARGTTLQNLLHDRVNSLRIIAEVASLYSLLAMADATVSLGLGAAIDLSGLPATGRWVPLEKETRGLTVYTAYRVGSTPPRAARSFRDSVTRILTDLAR
ncbi:LysR family transcriptional regulator [Corynebacterium glyciniphilum]|uniref:LysR family transcriptional regulator n=1 Tax=Corynebacterium glyciniphilum TaxID=1404244 RepID=UPI003FD3DE12